MKFKGMHFLEVNHPFAKDGNSSNTQEPVLGFSNEQLFEDITEQAPLKGFINDLFVKDYTNEHFSNESLNTSNQRDNQIFKPDEHFIDSTDQFKLEVSDLNVPQIWHRGSSFDSNTNSISKQSQNLDTSTNINPNDNTCLISHPCSNLTSNSIPIPNPNDLNADEFVQETNSLTSFINSNPDVIPPPVNNIYVDKMKCSVCGKTGIKHMKKHLLIHDKTPKFCCKFQRGACKYKKTYFKNHAPFKRHLINIHFKFNDTNDQNLALKEKMNRQGTCPCGLVFTAKEWIHEHVLTNKVENQCPAFSNAFEFAQVYRSK